MKKFVKGLIFDLDGTLIDSRRDILESVNITLVAMGLAALPPEQIAGYVGDGIKNLVGSCLAQFGREDLLDSGVAQLKHCYGQHLLDHTRPFPGVMEVLDGFISKRMAVISNKPANFTNQILDALGMQKYFSCVLGGDSLPVKKPDPLPVKKVLEEWKAQPSEVVIVGDSLHDIEAGKKAGILTCAVTYGFKSPEQMRQSGADWVIDALPELRDKVC